MSTNDSPVKSEPVAQAAAPLTPSGEANVLATQPAAAPPAAAPPAAAPVSAGGTEPQGAVPAVAPVGATPGAPAAPAAVMPPAPAVAAIPATPDIAATPAAALATPPASSLLGPPVKPAVDPDDDLGWAIGSELEYLEEGQDDWDGPTGDGLDEEEGRGGFSLLRP